MSFWKGGVDKTLLGGALYRSSVIWNEENIVSKISSSGKKIHTHIVKQDVVHGWVLGRHMSVVASLVSADRMGVARCCPRGGRRKRSNGHLRRRRRRRLSVVGQAGDTTATEGLSSDKLGGSEHEEDVARS